jgi:uncharacterized protein
MRKISLYMLLEFRINNFRSFGRESVLSLVASSDLELLDHNTAETRVSSIPRATRSTVIYGANASGKSNLLRGLQLMRGVVLDSVSLQPGQLFNVQPFALNNISKKKPTLFEVSAVIDGVRFQYAFEFTAERITRESLFVYQKSKPQRWFSRHFDKSQNSDVFELGTSLKGAKSVWREATRSNSLFLSTAVQFNSEQLLPLYQWFADALVFLPLGGRIHFDQSTKMLESPEGQEAITTLLRSADIAISSISAVPKKGFLQELTFDASGNSSARREERELLIPIFKHQANNITAEFEFPDESHGTQTLFCLAAPLRDVLENGKLLIVDELDGSLHPLLVRQIIRTFHDPLQNRSGAQLIFSTHNTTFLDTQLFRRDQVWFVEKDQEQSSELIPLTDFSPRKGEAIEKNYLSGRYGGVPILAEQLDAGVRHGKQK